MASKVLDFGANRDNWPSLVLFIPFLTESLREFMKPFDLIPENIVPSSSRTERTEREGGRQEDQLLS